MSEEKKGPTHRVSFARITGQDDEGRDILGNAREIGTVWERPGKPGQGILRFDHIPRELDSGERGIVFVNRIEAKKDERQKDGKDTRESKPRDADRDRGDD